MPESVEEKQFTYSDICANKNNVLIVVAHPDDSIVYFGALIHQLRKDGKNVYVVVVSNGARGSKDNEVSEVTLAKIRMAEERAALKLLTVDKERIFCLNYADGEVESNLQLIGKISFYLRKFKVDLVCTHEPSLQYVPTYSKDGFFVQHRDHRKVGEAVIDAAYPFSRDRSFFTEQYAQGVEPHTCFDILLTDELHCNFDFDYTEDLEVKKSALRTYTSQIDENFLMALVDAVKFNDRYLEKFYYVKLLW
jgi:LmbE family N-acetylglucosaminyl deacetylase